VGRLFDLIAGQPEQFFVSHYQLSSETDIRILVVRTLLTYLELDGYIRATSPRYDSYRIKPLVSSKSILDRIVKSVDYMAEQGWIEVDVSDLVHGYRRLRPIDQPKLLADELHERLVRRERSEIERVDSVYRLAAAKSCQAGTLAQHFGETMADPCGHCSACLGEGPWQIPSVKSRTIGSSSQRAMEELSRQYPDRFTTARERARFLCGLSSPGLVRARLTRHASYGVCAMVPFADVLRQVGGTAD
jgi:ATP-dependent DNA helicase RecQ